MQMLQYVNLVYGSSVQESRNLGRSSSCGASTNHHPSLLHNQARGNVHVRRITPSENSTNPFPAHLSLVSLYCPPLCLSSVWYLNSLLPLLLLPTPIVFPFQPWYNLGLPLALLSVNCMQWSPRYFLTNDVLIHAGGSLNPMPYKIILHWLFQQTRWKKCMCNSLVE